MLVKYNPFLLFFFNGYCSMILSPLGEHQDIAAAENVTPGEECYYRLMAVGIAGWRKEGPNG
jgi:hypothetical protein